MSRSGSRSGSNSSRRGSDSSRSKWDDDARQGSRGSSSRGRQGDARTARRNDDPGRGGAQQGGLWNDEGGWQGGESWQGDASWSNDGGWGETGLNDAPAFGQGARGGKPNPQGKQPLSQRMRYWMTADAWRMTVLRQWPSTLRLLLAASLLGSCAGLSFFVTRDQANAQGPASGRTSLAQQHVGPGTPTVALYQQDPWTPPALPSPSPTATPKPKPTATTAPIGLQAQLSSPGAQCQNLGDTLQPVTLTLTNSQSGAETWTLNLGAGPDGQPWAQPSASQGSVAPQTQQQVTLTPDATICGLLGPSGKPSVSLTTQVSVTPGAQPPTLVYVVTAPPGGGGGPGPTPSPSPSPVVSPGASPVPTKTHGG